MPSSPTVGSTGPAVAPGVLLDRVSAGTLNSLLGVLCAAAAIGLCAQVSFPLPGTPVPVTLQTFAVLVMAAALGPARGVAATAVYAGAGAAGIGWFAPGTTPAATGYLVGFAGAALVVGSLAERGMDRSFGRTVLALAAGDLVILGCGAAGLALVLDVSLPRALSLGVTPFLIGDAVKIVAAAVLLPAAWRLVGRTPTGGSAR